MIGKTTRVLREKLQDCHGDTMVEVLAAVFIAALGDSFDDAREKAYEACDLINFEGKQYRSDIGKRAAAGRAAWEN